MYSAKEIALIFAQKAIKEGKPITQMKLQKLVYFAHGVSLAKVGRPLISEDVQAWKFGPVVPAIYEIFKYYGDLPITNLDKIDLKKIKEVDVSDEISEIINYTWKVTEKLSATQLSSWSHKDGSPWQQVYNPYDSAIPIDNDRIKRYFESFLGQNN